VKPTDRGFWDDIVPQVDPELCRRCADCAPVLACLAGGIRRDGPQGLPYADRDRCFGCYSCVGACSHDAIIMPRVS
jgi:Fe-S-cluster-containing hydrogenase component 2